MEIADWRKKIDALESELILLLNKRATYALEIGKIKKIKNLPVLDSKRESEILESVANKNEGPLSKESIKTIFSVIMQETRKVEK